MGGERENMSNRIIGGLSFTVFALLGGVASADTLPSLDRATFQTAIANEAGLTLQDFDSLSSGTTLGTLNGVTYSSSTGSSLVTNAYLTSTGSNGLGRTGVGYFLDTDSITFTFANAITAFGIDVNTFAEEDGSYRAFLSTGDDAFSIFETFPGVGTGQFLGFVSDQAFTSVTISTTSGFPYSLDTLIYGGRGAVVGGVPEPSTWGLMLAGFAMVAGATRYGRRRVAVTYA